MRSFRGAAALAVLLLTACDSAAATSPTCAPVAPATPPSVVRGSLGLTVDTGTVTPGATVHITATVTGPASFMADCTAPLQLSITDSTGLAVGGVTAPTGSEAPCGHVGVAGGDHAVYVATWQPDPSLPSGRYTVSAELGDLPVLTLALPVRTADGGC